MYVCGKNVAKELINAKLKIKRVYLSCNFKDTKIINDLKELKIESTYLDKAKLDMLTKENHQGIVLEIEDFKYLSEKDLFDNIPNNPLIVILDHLQDPHNFGAIIRTCEAAGVDYIIIPKDRSVSVNSTVMKTSAGALSNVKIVQVSNLNNVIKKLKKHGIWIVGTDMNGTISYDEVDYRLPVAIIIGSEGFGMSKLVKENCDFVATIMMHGKINSLNASVAAAILIYEAVRQRK